MVQYLRRLEMDLPKRQSAFLWGPRKTGKSTYLKQAFPNSLVYDFLKTDLMLDFNRRPALLREQLLAQSETLLAHPIILDEVQRVPLLLDEVHWLIENKGLRFILCGSSARKLKRGRANLLGGRAWRYEMFPLVTDELNDGDMDILTILNRGLIPDHFASTQYRRSLNAYLQDYLKEEIFAEGLTRDIPAFSRFFEALGYSHGELTNFSNIARECGVSSKTAKEYYQILVDTLLGSMVPPFKTPQSRQVISRASKFYLFDVGVAGILEKRHLQGAQGAMFGKAFEHFIFCELRAHASYSALHYDVHFWRTKSGLEVDFVLGNGEVAIEIKGTSRVEDKILRPLRVFIDEYAPQKALVVCNEPAERVVGSIRILPWKVFLQALWAGEIIS
ncbi:MAG: AAA family ATPase [Gemmatimonadetes bacterium]|nr:AAA family ATPase [Gemmatimonadota bacterium]MDE2735272.1 AAA family ATPase [Gemmatimonadota bacterium]